MGWVRTGVAGRRGKWLRPTLPPVRPDTQKIERRPAHTSSSHELSPISQRSYIDRLGTRCASSCTAEPSWPSTLRYRIMIARAPNSLTTSPRSFVSKYRALGDPDVGQRRPRTCIAEIARKFGLGTNWMSHPADLAFPPGLSSTPRVLIPLS